MTDIADLAQECMRLRVQRNEAYAALDKARAELKVEEEDNARLRRFVEKIANKNITLPLERYLRLNASEVLEQQRGGTK